MRTFDEIREQGDLLYETIRGSNLFGLATEQSDIDTFGLFIAKAEELMGTRLRYVSKVSSEKNDDSWDELEKFVVELGKSNPNALEALFTPPKFILYKNPVIQPLLDIRDSLITKQCFRSFRGYAKSQINKMTGLSKAMNIDPKEVKTRKTPLDFCWVPRPGNDGIWSLEKWLRENHLKERHCGLVRLPNGENLYTIYYDWFADKDLKVEDYARLRYGKEDLNTSPQEWRNLSKELEEGKKTEMIKYRGIIDPNVPDTTQLRLSSISKEDSREPLATFQFNQSAFQTHCKRFKEYWEWVANRNPKRYESNKGHNFDAKNSCHAILLMRMGKEIAEGKGFLLDRTGIDREELLKIKAHGFSFEEVREKILIAEEEMKEAFEKSDLPEEPDLNMLEDILIDIRLNHYKIHI